MVYTSQLVQDFFRQACHKRKQNTKRRFFLEGTRAQVAAQRFLASVEPDKKKVAQKGWGLCECSPGWISTAPVNSLKVSKDVSPIINPCNYDLFKVIFDGFYHGQLSPWKTTIWGIFLQIFQPPNSRKSYPDASCFPSSKRAVLRNGNPPELAIKNASKQMLGFFYYLVRGSRVSGNQNKQLLLWVTLGR